MNGLLFLILGVALSALVIPLAIRWAPVLGMVDKPDPRKVHLQEIPRVGGVGIVFGSLVPLCFLLPWDPLLESFLLGAAILFVFGTWDDAKELTHWVKFVGQFAAAGLVVYHGNLWVERFPFIGGALLPAHIGQPFTVIAIVGVINAINHSDGLDGLAGGETLLCLIVMAFLSFEVGDTLGVFIACAVAGGILGFLRFNTHPARIFMGDSGSQFLGFSLAFLAVYLTQTAHPAVSPALPLLLIGLPLADINAVFYLRISGGMNWFRASRNHIHHRLLDLGFEHYETVIIIYLVQALLVSSAVLFRYQSDLLVTCWYIVVIAGVFTFLTLSESRGLSMHVPSERRSLARVLPSKWLQKRFAHYFEFGVSGLFAAILLTASILVGEVSTAVGIISGVLLLGVLTAMLGMGLEPDSIFFKFSTYAVSLALVYLLVQSPPPPGLLGEMVSTPGYLVLGVALAIAIRLTSESVFKTTATDYLIVFGLIAIAIFGREILELRQVSSLVIHSVVMVYASEFVCQASSKRISVTSFGVLGALLVLTSRAI